MATNNARPTQTYFEQQRELILSEIAANLENVLQNINHLNRSLEGVIAVGNEFSQVEGLWSQFENIMAKPAPTHSSQSAGDATVKSQDQEQDQQAHG